MVWLLPAGVAVLLALPVVLALRRCVAEASALRRSLVSFSELRQPVLEARTDALALRAAVSELRARSGRADGVVAS